MQDPEDYGPLAAMVAWAFVGTVIWLLFLMALGALLQ